MDAMTHPQMKMYGMYIALQNSSGCGAKVWHNNKTVFRVPIFEAHNIPCNILSYFTEMEQWKNVFLVGRSLNNMSTRALKVQFDEVAQLLLAHLSLRRGAARFDLHLP